MAKPVKKDSFFFGHVLLKKSATEVSYDVEYNKIFD